MPYRISQTIQSLASACTEEPGQGRRAFPASPEPFALAEADAIGRVPRLEEGVAEPAGAFGRRFEEWRAFARDNERYPPVFDNRPKALKCGNTAER